MGIEIGTNASDPAVELVKLFLPMFWVILGALLSISTQLGMRFLDDQRSTRTAYGKVNRMMANSMSASKELKKAVDGASEEQKKALHSVIFPTVNDFQRFIFTEREQAVAMQGGVLLFGKMVDLENIHNIMVDAIGRYGELYHAYHNALPPECYFDRGIQLSKEQSWQFRRYHEQLRDLIKAMIRSADETTTSAQDVKELMRDEFKKRFFIKMI